MTVLGFTGRGAETIEEEKRGSEYIVRVLARGVTERAAKRAARIEASGVIPMRNQEVVNVSLDKEYNRANKRYIVTVAER